MGRARTAQWTRAADLRSLLGAPTRRGGLPDRAIRALGLEGIELVVVGAVKFHGGTPDLTPAHVARHCWDLFPRGTLVDHKDGFFAIVLPLRDPPGAGPSVAQSIGKPLLDRLGTLAPASMGLSLPGPPDRLPVAWREAVDSLRVGLATKGEGSLTWYEDIRHLALFLDRRAMVAAAWQRTLAKLTALPQSRRFPLVATLEALVRTNGCLAEAAKLLRVHPNTVRYRLRELEKALGYNPVAASRLPETRLLLLLHGAGAVDGRDKVNAR